jgi:GTP-binding protein LepA
VRLEIITPAVFIGSLIQLVVERRGIYQTTDYLESSRVILYFELPLAELLTDFYDKLKSISSGYASLSYETAVSKPFRPVDLVKLNILVAGEEKEPLAMLVPRKDAERRAREVLEILKKEIPPALFEIRLQASIHSRIIASERIRPLRKDVTAKLYGGDVTRKMKLLEKQRKGKKKMAQRGSVEIPSNAYLAVLGRQI